MKSLLGKRAVVAAVGLAVLAGAGTAVAATQSSSSNPGAGEQAFVNDLAQRLGVTPSALTAAVKAAESDRIDAALAAGRLTTAEASALKARIQAATGPLPLLGWGGHPFGVRGGGLLADVSQYLEISPATLRADLQSGRSLDDIANSTAGKSAAGLKAAILAAVTSRLNSAVTNGAITSQQEQQRLSRLSSRLDTILSQPMTNGGRWFARGHRGPWARGGNAARALLRPFGA